jgi:hypothetical protein
MQMNKGKYIAGAAGVLAAVPMADAAVAMSSIELTTQVGVNDYLQLAEFADGASSISFTDVGISSVNDNLRFYGGSGMYWDGDVYGNVDLRFFYESTAPNNHRVAINSDVGDIINASSGIATNAWVYGKEDGLDLINGFVFDEKDYTGFEVLVNGRTHYGWMSFTMNSDNTLTLHDIAIETNQDTGITVVPEPGSLLLLAAGAAGILAYRRVLTK